VPGPEGSIRWLSGIYVLRFERENSNERHQLIIHSWHGSGAAQTEGARLNRLIRLVNEIEADIYLMGHLHAMTSHTPDIQVFNED